MVHLRTYVGGLCDPLFFFFSMRCTAYTQYKVHTKMDKREKCLQRRRERERSRRASETAEEREERLRKP